MALCRCLKYHSPPRSNRYTAYVSPMGYPNTALICGISNCNEPGVIWLNKNESIAYQNDQRIFPGPNNNFTKMRVDNTGLKTLNDIRGNSMIFEVIWKRIKKHKGEAFYTKTGLPFTYEVQKNYVRPYRNGNWVRRNIPRSNFEYAYENGPYKGPGEINLDVQGPTFVWAILNDDRITG